MSSSFHYWFFHHIMLLLFTSKNPLFLYPFWMPHTCNAVPSNLSLTKIAKSQDIVDGHVQDRIAVVAVFVFPGQFRLGMKFGC